MEDLFDVSEQRAIAKEVSELVRPLGLKIMVLGRVALFYRYGFVGSIGAVVAVFVMVRRRKGEGPEVDWS
jgi:hypothetical protein